MACKLYNNDGYGCGACTHFVKTTAVTLVGSVLVLNIPQATYSNHEKVCICVAQAIPDTVTSLDTVAVTIGASATQYPMITQCGNTVHADQIRARRVYHTHAATDTATFVVNKCELCPTSFNFPVIPAAAPAANVADIAQK